MGPYRKSRLKRPDETPQVKRPQDEPKQLGAGASVVDQPDIDPSQPGRQPLLSHTIFRNQPLTGGQRSLLSLERLTYAGGIGRAKMSTTQSISDLRWLPVSGSAIERDDDSNQFARQVWHAGHTSALLVVDPWVIAASQTGGVWLLNNFAGNYISTPLSDEWDDPDVTSLAFAPGVTDQFYAGCKGGSLYLVELQPVLGGMDRKQSTLIPLASSTSIWQVVVLEGSRRIVLACSDGVYWSPIPPVPANASGYSWSKAESLPAGAISGLAEGPNQTVVAAAWGSKFATGLHGIFHGAWDESGLVFSSSTINGVDQTKMLRTSLSSCAAQRSVVYAVSAGGEKAGGDYGILAVLASQDGGVSWTAVSKPSSPGFQGSYNNAIAVSPVRSNVVTLGWRAGGHFFSVDSGLTWTQPRNDAGPTRDVNLHADIHALYFARHGDAANVDWLFAGSDGGVVHTRDLGHTYDSRYSQQLRTLQFSTGAYGSYTMTLAASSRIPGLIAGGTQDNGNIFCYREGHRPWWFRNEGGDGGYNRLVDSLGSGALLRFNNSDPPSVRIGFWDPQREFFVGSASTFVPVDGDQKGLRTPYLEVVRTPTWKRDGKLMYAVAGASDSGLVYGLCSSTDGSDAQFSRLADAGDPIVAIDSSDGTRIMIATLSSGSGLGIGPSPTSVKSRILTLDSATGAIQELELPKSFQGTIFTRVASLAADRAFALDLDGNLLRYDGSAWNETAGGGFVVFEADATPGSRRIFAATDTSVFLSDDDGATWANASFGLPACPHCLDLRIAADGKGGHILYLSTHGRSVWWAQIDFVQKGPDFQNVPSQVAQILAGILGGGPGIEIVGGHIRHVGPHDPVLDILSAIAIDRVAQGMAGEAGREIRRAALVAVRNLAEKQLKGLQ